MVAVAAAIAVVVVPLVAAKVHGNAVVRAGVTALNVPPVLTVAVGVANVMPAPNWGVSTKPYAPAVPPLLVTVMVYIIGFAPMVLVICLSIDKAAGNGKHTLLFCTTLPPGRSVVRLALLLRPVFVPASGRPAASALAELHAPDAVMPLVATVVAAGFTL